MTFEKVSEFYKRAVEEKRFSEDFLAEAKSISSEDKLKKFFAEKVLPIAQNMGYDFTVDDLIAYERQVIRKISEEELENITGGASMKSISTAVMSFLMLAGNINPISSAVLSRKDILASAARLAGKPLTVGAAREDGGAAIAAADTATAQPEGLDKSEMLAAVDLCKGLGSRYVCKALNLLDPFALKTVGAIQDMRICDGNTTSVKVDGNVEEGRIPFRKFNEDQGVGSPNYMRTLFPSSSGNLNAEGGFAAKLPCFSVDCDPSPELVAGIAAYFYEFRNAEDKDAMTAELNEYQKALNVKKVSDFTDEKLFDRLYDGLKLYNEARVTYEKAKEDKSNPKIYKAMSVKSYLGSWREVENYAMSPECLQKVQFAYFKAHSDKCSEVKKKIESGFAGKFEKLEDFIRGLKYEDIKDKLEVMSELEKLDKETVLDDINEATKVKGKNSIYKFAIDALVEDLKSNGPKNPITFDDYVKLNYKENSGIICAIGINESCKNLLTIANGEGEDGQKREAVKKKVESIPGLLKLGMNGSDKNVREGLEKVDTFLNSNGMEGKYLENNAGIKKAKTILSLLKEGTYMIQNQETDDDKGSMDKYPKYTAEHMLMSYFIEHFNTADDIKRFYDQIAKLNVSAGESEDVDMKNRLDVLRQVIEKMPTNENVPSAYIGARLEHNGPTKIISKPDEVSKEVSFSGNFPDCADTVVRHILNLLFYCPGEKWLPEVVNDELKSAKESVMDAIEGKKTVAFRNLKERAQMFFTHQDTSKVNDGSNEMRSLWNYVVSNMDKDSPEPGLYKIRYGGGKNYELDTGFINMLRLIYNIEKALFESNKEKNKALQDAKTSIDSLATAEPKDYAKFLRAAIESVIKVVKPEVIVDVSVSGELTKDISHDDLLGHVGITLKTSDDDKGFNFTIDQNSGHAWVELTKEKPSSFDIKDLCAFKNDPIIKFFIENVFEGTGIFASKDEFYKMLRSFDGRFDSEYLAKASMLKLFKEAGGEREDHYERLYDLCEKYFSAKANVSVDKINLFELFQSIYRVSTLKHFEVEDITDFKGADLSADGNYKYIERKDGAIEICPTAKLKDAESITIPANIDGKEVKKCIISTGAFVGFTNLKEVTFAKGVENVEIGNFAFSAGSVKKLNIPLSVQSLTVGVGAFYDANNFVKLNIPAGVYDIKIGTIKFKNNTLTEMDLEGKSEIPRCAFAGISLPEIVTITGIKVASLSIGEAAFQGSSAKTLKFVNVCKHVGFKEKVFCDSEIENLVLEGIESVNVLSEGFYGSKVRELDFGDVKNLHFNSNAFEANKSDMLTIVMNDKGSMILNAMIFNNSAIETVVLKNLAKLEVWGNVFDKIKKLILDNIGVLGLNENVFNGYKDKILDGLDIIKVQKLILGSQLFSGSEIETVNLQNVGKLTILLDVFKDSKVTDLKLDNLNELILMRNAFQYYKGKSLIIPSSVKILTLPEYVFYRNEIATVDLQGVEELTIGDYVFTLNDKVKTLKLGSSLKKVDISPDAFLQTINFSFVRGELEKIIQSNSKYKELKRFEGLPDEEILRREDILEDFINKIADTFVLNILNEIKSAESSIGMRENADKILDTFVQKKLERTIASDDVIEKLFESEEEKAQVFNAFVQKIYDAFIQARMERIIVVDELSKKMLEAEKEKGNIPASIVIEVAESPRA